MTSRALNIFIIVAGLLVTVPSRAEGPAPNAPGDARIFTSDIAHFWEACDAMAGGDSLAALQTLYFDRGSQGLDDFLESRIESAADLLAVMKRHPRYYASLRGSTERVSSMEGDIRASFDEFKRIYPDAHFPDVYFLIGRMNSGGTTSSAGLLIGTEMYGRSEETVLEELDDWHRQVLKPVDGIPHIVAHELIHFQQPRIPRDRRTLLAASIHEGSADFLAELISGAHINGHVHEFCLPREGELWAEFSAVMDSTDYTGWLYGGQPEGRPADIGYFFGYRIAQSYYNHAADKHAAVRDILLIDDFNTFLAASEYQP